MLRRRLPGILFASAIAGASIVYLWPQEQRVVCAKTKRKKILILGGGIMGSCAAYHLAKRGEYDITLIDAGHPIRSSWGESRIARLAYADPLYIKMMMHSFRLWDELAKDASQTLMLKAGSLDITKKGSPLLESLLQAYDQLGVLYERFTTAEQLSARYPQIQMAPTDEAVFQEDGYIVLADVCVKAATDCAEKFGATVREGEPVLRIDAAGQQVELESGERLAYDYVSCLGPVNRKWTSHVNPYTEDEHLYCPDKFPTVIFRDDWPYALPHTPNGTPGIKVSVHAQGEPLSNDEFYVPHGVNTQSIQHKRKWTNSIQSDDPDQYQVEASKAAVAKYFPGIDATRYDTYLRCLYTNVAAYQPNGMPDRDFVVGQHPDDSRIYIGTGFNGEGFKFGIYIGEMLADLATDRPPHIEETIERFSPARLKLFAS